MFFGAYWKARQESRDETAVRVSAALQSLATINDGFSLWFKKGRSKKTASASPIRTDVRAIASLLKTNNRDDDGTAISELGFSVGLWNGSDSFPCSFNVTCGGSSDFVKNSVVLQLSLEGDPLSVLSEESLRKVLAVIVRAFDPDVALLTSNEFIDRAGGGAPWDIGGWLVYRRANGIKNLEVLEPVGILAQVKPPRPPT